MYPGSREPQGPFHQGQEGAGLRVPAIQGFDAGGEFFDGRRLVTRDRRLDVADAALAGVELLFHPLLQVVEDEFAQFDVGLETLGAIGGGRNFLERPHPTEQTETLADRAFAEIDPEFDVGKAEGLGAGETDAVDRRDRFGHAQQVGGIDEEGDNGAFESEDFGGPGGVPEETRGRN